jgi:hypothetical protein
MTEYLYVPHTTYGKERRKFIKDWFTAHPDGMYAVNCKWRPQVKDDSDLKKLIRIGFLKVVRLHISKTHAQSYVVRNDYE